MPLNFFPPMVLGIRVIFVWTWNGFKLVQIFPIKINNCAHQDLYNKNRFQEQIMYR